MALLLTRGRADEAAAEPPSASTRTAGRNGNRLAPRGMRDPACSPWRLHLGLAETREADLEAVARDRPYGAPSAIGQVLRVTAGSPAATGESPAAYGPGRSAAPHGRLPGPEFAQSCGADPTSPADTLTARERTAADLTVRGEDAAAARAPTRPPPWAPTRRRPRH